MFKMIASNFGLIQGKNGGGEGQNAAICIFYQSSEF